VLFVRSGPQVDLASRGQDNSKLKIGLKKILAVLALGSVGVAVSGRVTAQLTGKQVSTQQVNAEITEFTGREIAAHFADIKTLNPPPDRVLGALTVGEFSWGSFARTLAAQADFGGSQTIAGKDSARWVADIGLIESRHGGKAFAQLYSTLALRHYGKDLNKNAVWQSMTESERNEWKLLLDPTRFYDPVKRAPINLPENYLGVAARVAAMSYEIGVLKDKAFLDSLVERATEQFTKGAIYSDDSPPTGRYDRYSNEYVRFCWDAASIAGRNDIREKLKPSLRQQMKLWWDLVSPAGYGYNWGRSQGLVSYLDTVEIAAFLAENPEFRPAPLTEIAALYNQAWLWLKADYLNDRHLFNVFGFGRGNYSYITLSREWQQTGVGLGKLIVANHTFMSVMQKEGVTQFPSKPNLPDVSRFEFFNPKSEKPEGVWLYRNGKFQFALPITTGTKPAVADYLPAPFGLPGFAAPVEEVYPSMVPFLKLADGTYAACDGADEIVPGTDGRSLRVVTSHWAKTDSKSGERFDIGLTSTVDWKVDGNRLIRTETITANRDAEIEIWRIAVPSTASNVRIEARSGESRYILTGRDGKLAAVFSLSDGTSLSANASGDSKFGKGVLGAIPIHLVAEKKNISLTKGSQFKWDLTLELLK
jgi:hypothetical protein